MTAISAPTRSSLRRDWPMVWVVVRREVRDTMRDWRLVAPILLLTLLFPWLMSLVAQWLIALVEQYNSAVIGERAIPILLMVVGFFPTSFSLVIALEAFVGEQERKSLEPLLSTPLTDRQLYLGKMLAAVIPPVLGSYVGIIFYTIGTTLMGNRIAFQSSLLVVLLTTMQAALMVAASVVVSSQTTSVRAANMLASFILVPMSILLQFEAWLMAYERYMGLWAMVAAVSVTTLIFVRMGIHLFSRERLLGRNIDFLRLGWMVRYTWERFSGRSAEGQYPTPRQWYKQLGAPLVRLRLPIAVLLVGLVAAAVGGYVAARQMPLPQEMLLSFRSSEIQDKLVVMRDMMADLPLFIFSHNVRAMGLTAVLGTMTFGVASVFIFMLPWGVISFGVAQLASVGENPFLFLAATVLPHAWLELPAVLLVSAAALRWQAVIISPPTNRTVGEEWLDAGIDFMRIFFGLGIPLFLLAAVFESFVTPNVILWVYGA